jgi:VWFA-related protein
MLRSEADQAFLAGFNQRTRLLEPLTEDRTRLDQSLRGMDVPRGADGQLLVEAQGTALYDALAAAAQNLEPVNGRKAIVVLSDGIDTASASNQNAAIQSLQRADVLLYPIRVYDRKVFAFDVPGSGSDNLREGKKSLEKMARETGGAVFDLADTETLSGAFGRLEEELRSQYSLGYTPPSTGGSYRKIRVTVKPRGLTVQTREGYYSGA